MVVHKTDILIIGAGLTGLTLAYLLQDQGLLVTLVDARDRVGGRIYTKHGELHPPFEMGATWFGKNHTAIVSLLKELDIGFFEQTLGARAIYEPISTSPPQVVTLPPNDDPSYRIKGGSDRLIGRLLEHINDNQVHLNQTINSIEQKDDLLVAKSNQQVFNAGFVVSTLPPFLFCKNIAVSPALPERFVNVTESTHTWMGESIKVGLSYAQPFWRREQLSGTIFSNVGPIPEMYDHSNVEDAQFALVGFLNGNYYSVSKEERKAMVLRQLEKYYGEVVHNYLHYDEKVWRNDVDTFASYDHHVLPHQHGGHEVYQSTYLDNQLFIAGSETALQFPGYMEGAVRSAKAVCERLIGGA